MADKIFIDSSELEHYMDLLEDNRALISSILEDLDTFRVMIEEGADISMIYELLGELIDDIKRN